MDSQYTVYEIDFINAENSTSADWWLRVSTDNGSTWKSGASDYRWAAGGIGIASTNVTDDADSEIHLTYASYAGALRCGIKVTGAHEALETEVLFQSGVRTTAGSLATHAGWGRYLATTAVNALQILPSTGTITGTVIVRAY